MDQRKIWNENHKLMKEILLQPSEHSRAIELFLSQHGLLHGSLQRERQTMEDALLDDLDESIFRQVPPPVRDTTNSIAWHVWHCARIEDMTMNILIADEQQVLYTEHWFEKLRIPFTTSGNEMNEKELAKLSADIEMNALFAYRSAVGEKTQRIISSLEAGQLKEKVDPARINRLFEENAISTSSAWVAGYWSRKTIAGLLAMPATRHNFLHLNKCIRIKEKMKKMLGPTNRITM